MAKSLQQTKKQIILHKTIGIIIDILLVPILALTSLCLVSMFVAKAQHTTPSLFGYSAIRVVSNSMQNSGLKINDVVLVRQINPKALKKGDIIAFYAYTRENGNVDPSTMPEYVRPAKVKGYEFSWSMLVGKHSDAIVRAGKSGELIIVHQIVDIRQDSDGHLWFRTWGTSNVSGDNDEIKQFDDFWLSQDYIVGKRVGGEKVSGLFNFLGSNIAIILFVILPLTVLLTLLIIQLIDYIYKYKLEMLVVKGKLSLFDETVEKRQIGFNMSRKHKIAVLMSAPENERNLYLAHLWHNSKAPRDLNKYFLKQKWSKREQAKFEKSKQQLIEQYKKTKKIKYIKEYQQLLDDFYAKSFTKVSVSAQNKKIVENNKKGGN